MDNNFFDFSDDFFSKKNFSHAYLFNVDDSYDISMCFEFVKKIISTIIVDKNVLNDIFYKIDNGIFSDVKVIRPDGKFIKKDQLIDLMSEYKNSSVILSKRFYIIEYAEDLNSSSANTILKFLEEPENDIIAILVSKNMYNVIDTIISRCQVINFNKYIKKKYDDELINNAIEYLTIIEKYDKRAVAYLSDLYLCNSLELCDIFDVWQMIYEDAILYKYNNEIKNFSLNEDFINLFNLINYDLIVKKIKLLTDIKSYLNNNVNIRIALDKFILGGE